MMAYKSVSKMKIPELKEFIMVSNHYNIQDAGGDDVSFMLGLRGKSRKQLRKIAKR